jgi:drug/metabolite transporter (DMT)-like permease
VSRRGWLLFLAMGVIWGVPYLFIKIAVEHVPPASLVFLRTGLGALLLVPIAAARGELRPLVKAWRPLLAYTAAEVAVPWLFLNHAEQRLSSSLTGLLLAAIPLVSAVLAWVTRTDRLDWRRVLGLAVGIGGVAALVGLDLGQGDLVALLQMAVVAVGYALGPFLLARYLTDLPALGVVAASLLLTAIVYAGPAAVQLPRLPPLSSADLVSVVVSIVVLAVVCTAVAFLTFFKLIDEVGPTRATVITYLNPAVAVSLGVIFLGEPFTVGIVVGFVLVLLGSALATRRSRPVAGAESIGVVELEVPRQPSSVEGQAG